MTIVRKLAIEEERRLRAEKSKSRTLLEDMFEELEDLSREDPDLGFLVDHLTWKFNHTVRREGISRDTATLLTSCYLDTHLALVQMFKRELELRSLERTFGK